MLDFPLSGGASDKTRRDDDAVVHVGFKARGRLSLVLAFGERAHVSWNQYSRDHRASCGAKLDSWTWRACSRMPDMTRSASSRARRPAAPSTIGCVRVRTDSRKERSSARSGSSGVVGTFSNPIFGCALFSCRICRGSGFRVACFHANAENILAREVERDVFVLLEEAHFADAFGGDAAGGEIRDGAGFKFDAGVGDVHFVADDGDADGFEVDDRRVDEREQDVEVVDHHVVNDVDVEAARRKNAEAMDFEKHRARDDFSDGDDGGIEAFDVADLKNAAAAFCGGDERVGFVERCGDGLFDEYVNSGCEDAGADARVLGGWDGEADGVDAIGRERVEVAKNAGAEFRCNFLRAVGVGIDDADKLGAFDFAPDANVVTPEIADTDDSYANGFLAQDFLFASKTGDAVAADFAGANAWIAMLKSSAVLNQLIAIKQQSFSGVDGKCSGVRAAHDFDCLRAYDRNVEAHVLRWLADFDDDETLAADDAGGAFDRLVGSFHCFDRYASAIADDDRLAEIERGDFLRDFAAVGDVRGFGHVRRATASGFQPPAKVGPGISSSPRVRCLRLRARERQLQSANRCFSSGGRIAALRAANRGGSS